LDKLPHADYVIPALDEWKHWTKMDDWDSRNRLLTEFTGKLRRKEATTGEIQLLVIVCRPTWAAIAANLRLYAGIDGTDSSARPFGREELRRVEALNRAELDQVIQHALMDALCTCPRPFPRRFFPWLREILSYRALDHLRDELDDRDTLLPEEVEIHDVLDDLFQEQRTIGAAFYAQPASPGYAQWLRTFDMPTLFELADEYAPYARARRACERAVSRLPDRQRQVVEAYYFEETPQAEIARGLKLASSSVRNTHQGALKNLRKDDQLFGVLASIGKVRDEARRLRLERSALAA
jgi:RNA polymerase sigma factor (sigma-70 family)